MRRILKAMVYGAGALVALVVGLAVVTAGHGDARLYPPTGGADTVPVFVVDHGYHAGLIVGMDDLGAAALELGDPALIALHARLSAYRWVELGWGDGEFYRFAPALSDVTVAMAFGALTGAHDGSVLHVVGLERDPATSFPGSDVQTLRLSRQGFRNLLDGVAATFALDETAQPVVLGPGLYGPSLFYRATGRYSLVNTCNHWLGRLLASAGLKVSPLPAATSAGLLAELRWRNAM
jgi:uncharacterized protein (TIGR02117 family)